MSGDDNRGAIGRRVAEASAAESAAESASLELGEAPRSVGVKLTVSAGESGITGPESFRKTMHVEATVVGHVELPTMAGYQRYVTAGELGRGGMGRVDVVFDRVLGRYVAQKEVLSPRMAPLMVSEAQVGAQLEHPSIVPVYDLRTDETGQPRYTMRIVKGRSLGDIMWDETAERPPLSQLLNILRQVCLAVDYAHSRGVVHRDLKPDNILVGSFGEVYVLDWGIAALTEASDLHRSIDRAELQLAGTPAYMAPEQAYPGGVAPAADVYALGAMLYEILTGMHPFADASQDLQSVRLRKTAPPPSRAASDRKVPAAFDALVTRCLARRAAERPSARALADAIDAYLDGERERAEREREADLLVQDARRAWDEHAALSENARALDGEAQALLSGVKPHDGLETKMPGWERGTEARRLSAEAAQALARAEIAYASALGRVADHEGARAGLARLHYEQFVAAEEAGDAEGMARHLELARSYDDGALALELADEGELWVESEPTGVEIAIARYENKGLLLALGERRALGRTPTKPCILASGSYLATAEGPDGEIRYPLRIERARTHRLDLRIPDKGEIPDGMVLVPGGPFLAPGPSGKLEKAWLPDFAIGRFPVTMGEYAKFLDALGEEERERRVPRITDGAPLLTRDAGRWALAAECVESEAWKHVPLDRELELPVHGITFYDALAYARWLGERSGRRYRLPTALEWEKAARGADGRVFPMGSALDPSFAKLRQSRPETSQPEPVGAFSLDESPCGARDLAGGVADWTATMLDGRPPPDPSEEGSREADERQARYMGGHWGAGGERRVVAYAMGLKFRNAGVGFRLVLDFEDHTTSEIDSEPMMGGALA